MNRRSFLSRIILAAAAPMILPPAITYVRKWTAPDRNALDLDRLLNECYRLNQNRNPSDTIDCFTTRETAEKIKAVMAKYYTDMVVSVMPQGEIVQPPIIFRVKLKSFYESSIFPA